MTERTFPDQVVDAFRGAFGRQPEVVVRAPGRVNLLGAHVDYNDGWVMPAAIDRAVWLAAAPASGHELRARALDFDQEARLDLEALPTPVPQRPAGTVHGWIDYPAGVAWALCEAGHRPAAIDVAYASDVPIGAGVSSSAAVEIAFSSPGGSSASTSTQLSSRASASGPRTATSASSRGSWTSSRA